MSTISVGSFLSFQDSINADTQVGDYQTTEFFFQNFFISQTMD